MNIHGVRSNHLLEYGAFLLDQYYYLRYGEQTGRGPDATVALVPSQATS